MIQAFVTSFEERKHILSAKFAEKHPSDYQELVTDVVGILNPKRAEGLPDPKRIEEIDHGPYQGTLLYIIAECGYQPSDYWFVKVDYGSCSGCDTLQGIRDYSHRKPTKRQVKQYMTLALHIIQELKELT